MIHRRDLFSFFASLPFGPSLFATLRGKKDDRTIKEKHDLLLMLDHGMQFISNAGGWSIRTKIGFVRLDLSYPRKYMGLDFMPEHRLNVHSTVQSGVEGLYDTEQEAIEAAFDRLTNIPPHCYLLYDWNAGGGPLCWNGRSWEISDIEKHKAAALELHKDQIRDDDPWEKRANSMAIETEAIQSDAAL